MEILIGLFSLVFLALALRRLDWAILFILVFLPSYLIRFQIFSIPFTLLESMILTAFAVWFFKELPNLKKRILVKNKKQNYPFWREIIALLIISFGAVAVAGFSTTALGIWKAYFFEPVLLFILIINNLSSAKNRDRIFISLACSAFIVSVVAIYQKITGHFIVNEFWAAYETRRVTSWFSYPNALGLFLAPIVAILSGFFYYLPKRTDIKGSLKKIFLIITILVSILSIYFARSDGALIALLVAFFIFAVLAGGRKRYLALVFSLIFISTAFFYQPLGDLVKDKLSFADLSGQIRLQQWQETKHVLKNKAFILGNGLNGYQNAVEPYHQEGIFFNSDGLENFNAVVWASSTLREKYWQPVEIYLYPHNIFLNFWTELGFFGLIIFLWLIIRFLLISLQLNLKMKSEGSREKYIALGLLSAMLVILIHGLVDVPYFKNDLSALFFVLLALLGIVWFENKKLL